MIVISLLKNANLAISFSGISFSLCLSPNSKSLTLSWMPSMTTLAGGFLVINYYDAGRKDFKK